MPAERHIRTEMPPLGEGFKPFRPSRLAENENTCQTLALQQRRCLRTAADCGTAHSDADPRLRVVVCASIPDLTPGIPRCEISKTGLDPILFDPTGHL